MSFIERLELTQEEKQVYQLLLGCGQLTSYEIAQFSNLHYSNVNQALNGLQNKGAVGVSEGYLKKYFVRIPLDYLGETSDKLSTNVKSNINAAATFIENKKQGFNEIRTNLVSELDQSVAKKKEVLDQRLSQISSNLQSTAQEKKDSTTQKTTELSTKVKTMQETQQQAIQSSIDELLKGGVESLNQAKTSFNTVTGNIKLKNDESSLSVNNDIEQKTQSTIESVDAIAQSFKPKLGELNQSFAGELNDIVGQIQQNIDVTKMDVRAFNRSQADKYIGFSEETTRKTGDTIDGISETVSSNLSELNSSLELILNRRIEDLSLQVQEAVGALNEKISGIKAHMMEELIQQKNTAIGSAVSQIKESMALKYTDLQNSEQNQRNNMISERDMFSQKLEVQYNEAIEEYNSKVQEIKSNTASRFNDFGTQLSAEFEEIRTNIISNLNQNIQSFKNLSSQLNSIVASELDTGSTRLKEKWSDLIEKIELLVQENETSLTQQYQEASNLMQSTINSISEELNDFVQQTFEASKNITSNAINTSKASLDEGKEQIAGNLSSEIDETMAFLESSEQKFNDTANFLIGATMKLKNDFRSLDATSKEVTIPPVQTTSIVGLDAVLDHISRITGETKRGVTIMSPKPEYVPLDVIKQLPTTVKVTIVTKLDEQIDSDWINSASSAQANVEIRKFREMGTGVEMPQFIGVERENEEVLIAAQDEATQQVVGILSRSTYFAKLVSYIVISDYARGRSTQIK